MRRVRWRGGCGWRRRGTAAACRCCWLTRRACRWSRWGRWCCGRCRRAGPARAGMWCGRRCSGWAVLGGDGGLGVPGAVVYPDLAGLVGSVGSGGAVPDVVVACCVAGGGEVPVAVGEVVVRVLGLVQGWLGGGGGVGGGGGGVRVGGGGGGVGVLGRGRGGRGEGCLAGSRLVVVTRR